MKTDLARSAVLALVTRPRPWLLGAAALCLGVAAGCNGTKGPLDLPPGGDGSGGANLSSGSGDGTGTGTGRGSSGAGSGNASSGQGSGTGVTTTGSGAGGAATGAGTTGAGTTSAATTTSAGTGGAPGTTAAATSGSGASTGSGNQCMYPMGGYGIDVGSTIDPTFTWQGYPANAAQASTIAITDYFDCDGSKGINAVLIDISATWCGACQMEAGDFSQNAAAWQAKGIRVLTLMIQDDNQNPATIDTANQWRMNYNLNQTDVAADPNQVFLPQNGSVGLPTQFLVDPRTMKILSNDQGYSGDYSALEGLAAKNKH